MFCCDPPLKPARAEGSITSKLAADAKDGKEEDIVTEYCAISRSKNNMYNGWEETQNI